jgi:hypothetical protein
LPHPAAHSAAFSLVVPASIALIHPTIGFLRLMRQRGSSSAYETVLEPHSRPYPIRIPRCPREFRGRSGSFGGQNRLKARYKQEVRGPGLKFPKASDRR